MKPTLVRESAPVQRDVNTAYLPRQESHSFGIEHNYKQNSSFNSYNSKSEIKKNNIEEVNMTKGNSRSAFGQIVE